MAQTDILRIAGLVDESIVDGPGFRYAVFTQGCTHNCPGCHNPHTHDPNGGREIVIDEIVDNIKKNPLLDGITLTGGDPFLQAGPCALLAQKIKQLGLTVVTYTGYTLEELLKRPDFMPLLEQTDILIDGPFQIEKRSLDLLYKGSLNQRIIDVPASLKAGKTVEWTEPDFSS